VTSGRPSLVMQSHKSRWHAGKRVRYTVREDHGRNKELDRHTSPATVNANMSEITK